MSNLALRVLTAVVALPLLGALVFWREPRDHDHEHAEPHRLLPEHQRPEKRQRDHGRQHAEREIGHDGAP